jgi:hypothetical protein
MQGLMLDAKLEDESSKGTSRKASLSQYKRRKVASSHPCASDKDQNKVIEHAAIRILVVVNTLADNFVKVHSMLATNDVDVGNQRSFLPLSHIPFLPAPSDTAQRIRQVRACANRPKYD